MDEKRRKEKENILENLKNLTLEWRKKENRIEIDPRKIKKERKEKKKKLGRISMEQRFGRRGLSIDPMGRFPGEISPAREIYIYIERRVSWAEVEWLRGKTRTGKSYAL